MNKAKHTPLTDEYLQSLEGMKPAGTEDFFYTRLVARMERGKEASRYPLRPAFVIGVLTVCLFANSAMIIYQQNKNNQVEIKTTAAQNFAESFNLNVDSNY